MQEYYVGDLGRLSDAVRRARAALRAAHASVNDAQDALNKAAKDEFAAQAELDRAIAELVGA